ncbi:MAG: hypothetical protein QM582_06450 [Micropruina sp.]|uniref:hypothetical protein n=1 Tax=Micropruina sp. TaxID=2737536 RepID=UPI0039E6E865
MRTPGTADAVAAELIKLRTLPAAVLAAVGTVLAGAVLGAALAASAVARGVDVAATDAVLAGVPFVQAGMLVLGALPFAHEYAGSQIRSTLTAVPDRSRVLLAKTVAALLVVTPTAALTMVAAWTAAAITLHRFDPAAGLGPVAGAAGYLVLIALLASGAALLVRGLMPALAGTLTLVLIVSPLLAAQSEHARWLPDRAAQRLYAAADGVLTPAGGTLVALGWILLIGGFAAARFVRRDA